MKKRAINLHWLKVSRVEEHRIKRHIIRYFEGIAETDLHGGVPPIWAINLKTAGVNDIKIRRHLFRSDLVVTIYASCPGLLIGKKGNTITGFVRWIREETKRKISVAVVERDIWSMR